MSESKNKSQKVTRETYAKAVLVYENKSDIVTFSGKHTFKVLITVGLAEFGDFYIKIVFNNLNETELLLLRDIYKEFVVEFTSDLIKNEKYPVTHIIVTEATFDSNGSVIFEGLSD